MGGKLRQLHIRQMIRAEYLRQPLNLTDYKYQENETIQFLTWAMELKRVFSKDEIEMASKHLNKKCSTSSANCETQVKTTLRLHFATIPTLVRMESSGI